MIKFNEFTKKIIDADDIKEIKKAYEFALNYLDGKTRRNNGSTT